MMRKYNRVKDALRQQRTVHGMICRTLSPPVVELIGLCGFDFVWIDMEHTTADALITEELCRAADAVDMEALVRVPDQSQSHILRALEGGAGIVNVPQVEDASEAAAIVRAAKYSPVGMRGYSSASRGTRYGMEGTAQEVFASANERVMVMVQIESVKGVDNAEAICAVPGIDIVFVGMGDLSQSLGVTGQMSHARLIEATERVVETIVRSGKTPALQIENAESARKWIAAGVRIICCGVDIGAMKARLLSIADSYGVRRELTSAR
jgi:4-hydroxy-2-oxoheptanedioate aldolase